jgi:DNA-binding protein YbaB
MSTQMPESIQQAKDELLRQQERLRELRGSLRSVTTKTTSKDGMVTVTTGGSGELTSIAFNTAKFRRMAPAELGAVLVETIGRASAQRRDQVLAAYRPFMPGGTDLDQVLAGKLDLNQLADDAIRRVSEIMTDRRPGDAGTRSTRKG